jgi:hypothetical protein
MAVGRQRGIWSSPLYSESRSGDATPDPHAYHDESHGGGGLIRRGVADGCESLCPEFASSGFSSRWISDIAI